MTRLLTVWDDRYHSTAASLTSTTKQRAVVARADREGLVRLVDAGPFEADAVWADIAATHAPAYVNAVRTGTPLALAESQWFDWSPTFAEAVARIWRGHRRATALALAEGTIVAHPVSGAHHARYAEGSAFCTFNYLATAPPGTRVLVLDLDAHYGDGTDAMTKGSRAFTHFDIHAGVGEDDEVNARGQWYAVRNSTEYFRRLRHHLPVLLDEVKPDLIYWQAGMDPFEFDPVGGIAGMNARALYERDLFVAREIVERQIPTVVTLAGGYVKDVDRLHVQTFRAVRQAFREEEVSDGPRA